MGRGKEEEREKGREGGEKGTKAIGGTVEDMAWNGGRKEKGKEEGRERVDRGYSPTHLNSWRHHCRCQ